MQQEAKKVFVADALYDYATRIVEETRNSSQIRVGASPRALLAYVAAAKALALLRGRTFVTPDDFKRLAIPVLAHRISVHAASSFAEDGAFTTQHDMAAKAIKSILEKVDCPTEDFSH